VNEIIETERNYVNHLEMLQNKFIARLRGPLDDKDIKMVFANTEVCRQLFFVLVICIVKIFYK